MSKNYYLTHKTQKQEEPEQEKEKKQIKLQGAYQKFLEAKEQNKRNQAMSEQNRILHNPDKLDSKSRATLETLYAAKNGEEDSPTHTGKHYINEDSILAPFQKRNLQKRGIQYETYSKSALEEQFKKDNNVGDKGLALYMQYLKEAKNKDINARWEEQARQLAKDTPAFGSPYDVIDWGSSLPAGILAAAESVRHKFDADPNSPVDTNSGLYRLQNFNEAYKQQQMEDLKNRYADSPAKSTVANIGYGAYTSTGEMIPALLLGAGAGEAATALGAGEKAASMASKVASLPSFGATAYSSTLKEAQNRGLPQDQAVATAVVSGVSEMATEILSLDYFWDIARKGGKAAARNSIVNWLAMSGIEGSEEGANDVINEIADRLINADQSEYSMRVQNYMNNGLTEQDAKKQATLDFWAQFGTDVAAGAISGGVMGGGAVAAQSRYNSAVAKNVEDGDYLKVVENLPTEESAYENKTGIAAANDAVNLAQSLAKKAEDGTEITQKEKKKLVGLVSEARQNMSVRSEEAEAPAEEKRSKAQIMADMSKAKNARELTKAYHEAVENIPAENRQDADNLFNIKAGQLNLTTAQVNSARMSDADVYNAGYENKRIDHLTPQQQVTYREGAMKRFEEEARATAEVTGKASNDAGKEFTVKEINGLDSNDMTLLTDDGEVKLSQVKFANKGEQTLYNQAAQMGSVAAAKAYVDNYVPGMPVRAYDDVAQKFYTAGQLGTSFDSMRIGPFEKQVGTEGLRSLYEAGREVDKAESKQTKKTTTAKKGEGKVIDSRESKGETLHRGFLGQVAEKFGIDIEITESLAADKNGTFEPAMGRLVLNTNNPDMYKTLFHELSEFGQAYNAEGMDDLRVAMMEYVMDKAPDSLRQSLIAYQNAYKQVEGSKSISEASEELFNDLLSEIFRDEAGIQDFVNWVVDTKSETEAKGLIQRLAELIQKICDSISKYVSGNRELTNVQKTAAEMDVQRAKEMRSKLLQAFDEAIKNRDTLVGQEGQAEARHSLDVFAEQFDAWNKKKNVISFKIPITGTALKTIGVNKTVAEFDSKKVLKVLEKHPEMTDDVIKQLPNVINDPIVIMQSKGNKGRVVCAAELKDANGDTVIVVLELNPKDRKGNSIDVIKVASAYGKVQFQNMLNTSRILYVSDNKKRISNWRLTTGLQLPFVSSNTNSTNIVAPGTEKATTTSSRHSLVVDTENRKLTPKVKEYFKNSKLVDEQGRLKEMYHGTRYAGFTVFQLAQMDDGMSIFLTDKNKVAKTYAGTYDFYEPDRKWSFNELETAVSYATGGDWEVEQTDSGVRITELGFVDQEEVAHDFATTEEAQNYFIDNYLNKMDLKSNESAAVYRVYGNAVNPLIVDADNNNWDELPVNNWNKHYGDVNITKDGEKYQVDYMDGTTHEWHNEVIDSFEALERKFGKIPEQFQYDTLFFSDLYLDKDGNRIPTNTREYAQYAKTHGYDSVIIQNVVDSGLYGNTDEQTTPSTVAILFNPNQVKSIYNQNPTENEDIRYSIDVQPERVFYTKAGTEVVQNPTSQEYSQMREDILQDRPWLRGSGEPLFRHTYDEQGNEYYWDAMGGLHAQVEPEINKKYNTRTSQQWNWWTREDKDDYPVDYGTRYSIELGDVEKEAIEHFGTTDNFRVAGYMLQDGTMLDFSGAHWLDGESPEYIADWKRKNDIRQVDHEDITEVFDDEDAYEKMVDERGNIRMMPESPGVSISSTVEPTAAQYRQLKEFIRETKSNPVYNNYDFFVDIGAKSPQKLAYRNNINEDRVVNDIKRYYETGEVSPSALNDFRYSLGGIAAETADRDALKEAQDMFDAEMPMEDIFKKTGWYLGADNRWKFEISNENSEVHPYGYARSMDDPTYPRWIELRQKINNSKEISDEEFLEVFTEFDKLSKEYQSRRGKPLKLVDVLKNDELFKAYPSLARVTVEYKKNTSVLEGYAGQFDRNTMTITVDDEMSLNAKRSTILHEVQHAIQYLEGFARGSNLSYWSNFNTPYYIDKGDQEKYDREKAILEDLRERAPKDFITKYDKQRELLKQYYSTNDESILDKVNEICVELTKENNGLLTALEDAEFNVDIYEPQLKEMLPSEAYYATAGEIEAREVQNRLEMSADERKNTLPKTKTENGMVVFSENYENPLEPPYRYKKRYSLNVDTQGHKLSAEQQEFFKDSKVRDESGKLKVMYHGTARGGFTVFDPNEADDNISLFFTDREGTARTYSGRDADIFIPENDYTFEPGNVAEAVYPVYLNATNPLVVEADGHNWNDIELPKELKLNVREYKYLLVTPTRGGYIVDYTDSKNGDTIRELSKAEFKSEFGDFFNYLTEKEEIDAWNSEGYYVEDLILNEKNERVSKNTRFISNEAKRQGYDSVIFNNLVDYGTRDNDNTPAQVVVVFDSNQVKSIENKRPTKDSDIRYALNIDNDFGMWDTEDLQGTFIDEDGQELDLGNSVINAEETISGLARYLQAANEPLKGHKVNASALQQIAEDLVKKYNSTADVNVVADNLKIVFDYLQKTDDINYNEITKLLSEVSRPIIEQSGNVNEEMVELYEAFKGYIKNQKIALTDGQKKAFDLTPYGSFNNYRKANFGTLNFVNDGASLDSLWTEMCEKAKGFLDVDTNEEDMGIALADALTAMKPQAESLYGYDAREASIDLAGQIMEAYYKAEQEAIAQDMIESGMASPTAKYMIESARKDMKKEIMDYRKKTTELYNKQLEDMQGKISEIMAANNALAYDVRNLEKKNEQLTKKMAEQVVKAKARNKTTELKRYVEAEEIKKQKEEINKIAVDLLNRATNPTNKKYMQEGLRKPIAEFLTGIDFVSHRARLDSKNTVKWTDRMQALRKYLSNAAKGDEPEAIGIVLDPDLIEDMDRFATRNSEVTKVSKLPSWDLKELHSILSRLRTAVNKSNEMFTNELYKNQVDFNQAAYVELKEQNSQKNINKLMNGIRDFLNKDLEDPVTYFELLGETHKTLFDSLLKGFDKRAEHIREYVEFMKKLQQGKEQFYKWENKKHTFQLEEGTLEITEAQIMSLYETMQREQAKGHILPSGFKVSKVTVGGKEIIQNKPVRIKPAEYLEIINTLSAEQKEVADAIQKFMAVNCAKWGNNTSMKLFGYKKFNEKNYFPIKTDATSRDTNQQDVSKQAGLWANKNMSASKELTIGANNAIVIGDIFDVFADHVTDMATYDGMVLPQMDAMRWFNYREIFKGENETGEIKDTYSIKEQLQRLMGTAGTKYFENLMLGINGMEPKARSASAMTKFIGNYKKAAVTAKIRVAIQQPTAIIRAMDEMNGKYISKALATTNFAKYSKIAQEKSNLAWWKAQGYYEAYLGKSIKDMAVGKNPALQAIDDYAGFGAQKADDLTWGALYHAVEYEIADTTDLKPGTEAFDAAVVDRFEDVVTKTQVVDTMIHRTDIMRNQNDFVKLATSFMAEPLKTYNMCLRSIAKFARAPHDKKMWRKLIRTIIVYTLNNAILTAVTSSWDAVRDDDDKTPYGQRWIDRYSKEFIDNMNPVNMLPYVKDVVELFESRIKGEYYSSTDMATAGFDKAATFLVHLGKVLSGEKINKTPYGLTMEGLQAIQTLSGMPIYNVVNDINTVHNGLTDNWETKQSTSDYGDLHKAITKGKDVKEEVQELLEMGKDKNGIKSSITGKFKEEYQEATGEDKQQIRENVTEALVEAGYTQEEAQNTLDKWDGVEVTEPQYEEYHSDYESVYDSIDKGGNVQSEVQKMLDSGKQPAGIKSAITRKYKDQLVQTRDANLRNALVRAYMAAGDTNEEANEKIESWLR